MVQKFFIYVFLLLIITSCSKESIGRWLIRDMKPKYDFSSDSIPSPPDYTNKDSWLIYENKNKPVDIFYIYPTAYYSPTNWNQALDFKPTLQRTLKYSVRKQLYIFKDLGNVYAPIYRQANLYAFIDNKGNGEKAINLAYNDIKNAFDYYIKNINKHKPFILVGHSQGSLIILRLLEEYQYTKILNRMIVAYAVGWPLTKNYLEKNPKLKVCKDSCQTGCIISWNTEGKHKLYSLVKKPSVSVNPLSWRTDNKAVDKSKHLGAVFVYRNGSDTIYNYTSAQNINGRLVIPKPDNVKDLWMPFKWGNYHVNDYSIFYFNIQKNAKDRIRCFWKH